MDCVIYIRWSSAEQSKGSSLERQRADCRRHAAANEWKVVAELVDDGISAFKGQHAATGALGQFVRDVEAGAYPNGVVLLCEKLDRLSRQEPGRVFLWMLNLAEAGVVLATVDGARRYAKGNFDMAAIIEVVVKAQLSHEESEKKSQRLAAAWAAKRRRLEAGDGFVMTRRAPAWLEVVGSPPRFVVIPARTEIVRRIFEETVAGFGKHHIARNLNRDGVPPFGRGDAWQASYVQKILTSPAVLGDFQPCRKPRGSERTRAGDVVARYYPAAIDADLHARARAAMADRARRYTGRGRRLVNLFSGLAHCGECGAKMTFRGKGRKQRADGSWVNEDYLVCDSYQRGRGCGNRTHFNYAVWERGALDPIIFEALWERDPAPQFEVQQLEIELAEACRNLTTLRTRAQTALDLALETNRHEAKSAWLELTGEADAVECRVDDLRDQLTVIRGATNPGEHVERIDTLRNAMHHEDEDIRHEARAKIMAAVHALVTRMTFHGLPRGITMELAGERIVHVHFDEMANDTDWSMHRIDGEPFDLPWRCELEDFRRATHRRAV